MKRCNNLDNLIGLLNSLAYNYRERFSTNSRSECKASVLIQPHKQSGDYVRYLWVGGIVWKRRKILGWWKANNVIAGMLEPSKEARTMKFVNGKIKKGWTLSKCNHDENWNPLWWNFHQQISDSLFKAKLRFCSDRWKTIPVERWVESFTFNQCTASTNNRLIKNLIKSVSLSPPPNNKARCQPTG